jgi:phospholipid transport system substrate-binding protein
MPRALLLLVLGCAFLTLSAGHADTAGHVTGSPQQTVATLHAGLTALASEHAGADVERRYEALRPLVAATHDLAFIAEFTIRRQWSALQPADRARFVAAFERLSVMTYASRFAGVDDETFAPLEAGDTPAGRVEVRSAIRRAEGADIPLEYVLEQRDGDDWRIINIVADGVSDLALKRAEYQRVIADGGIDALLAHIDEQVARLVN